MPAAGRTDTGRQDRNICQTGHLSDTGRQHRGRERLIDGSPCLLQVRLTQADSIEGVIARRNLSSKEYLVGAGADLRNCVVKGQVRAHVH